MRIRRAGVILRAETRPRQTFVVLWISFRAVSPVGPNGDWVCTAVPACWKWTQEPAEGIPAELCGTSRNPLPSEGKDVREDRTTMGIAPRRSSPAQRNCRRADSM